MTLSRLFDEQKLEFVNMMERDGRLPPVVVFGWTSGRTVVMPIHPSFTSPVGKQILMQILRVFAETRRPDFALMAFEAWDVVTTEPDLKCAPSEHPDRTECIFVAGEARDGTRAGWRAPILRGANGKPTVGTFVGFDAALTGAMFGIFPTPAGRQN